MDWEHTDISMAARAGRLDELRSHGELGQKLAPILRQKRRERFGVIASAIAFPMTVVRRGLARTMTAIGGGLQRVAAQIAPPETAPIRVNRD